MRETDRVLRGIIDLSPIEVEELNRLKEKIYTKKGKREELEAEFKAKASFLEAGIPSIYWDLTWEDFRGDPDAKKMVKKYCDMLEKAFEAGQGFLFTGKHGTGKTLLSTLIAKEAIAKGYSAKYIPVSKLLGMIMDSFDDKTKKDNLDTMLERVEFLILDDLGKEYLGVRKQLNPMVQLKLDGALRERMNRGLVTTGSTNFDIQTINKQYGDSVLSVVLGSCKILEVKGTDFRMAKGQKFWKDFQ